nr:MAG: wsv390-like protein [Hemigrapsus takanoi nimavirus]
MTSFIHSVRLGQTEPGVPEIGLGASDTSCLGVSTIKTRRDTRVVTSCTQDLEIFKDTLCASALRDHKDVTEHFETVTISRRSNDKDAAADYKTTPFGFFVDNRYDTRGEHSLLYIYSTQDERMVFDGFATSPGKFNDLVRYETEDRAFCLRKNTTLDLYPVNDPDVTAATAFEKMKRSDVCGFVILVTQAKEKKKEYVTIAEDRCGTRSMSGLMVQTDGASTRASHANLLKGKTTSQKFSNVKLEHTGAPIHIYKVAILITQETGKGEKGVVKTLQD